MRESQDNLNFKITIGMDPRIQEDRTLSKEHHFNPLTAGVAYIRVFIFY